VTPNEDGVGCRILRISAGTKRSDFVVDLSDTKFAAIDPGRASQFMIQPGDLLACRFNGNRRFVGRVTQVPSEIQGEIIHPDKLIMLRAPVVRHDYLRIALNSSCVRAQIDAVASTTAGNVGINGRQLQNLLVPLAPLAEQARIVERVDEMFADITLAEATMRVRDSLAEQATESMMSALSAG
jgi:type I restriction enzyme S subunit